MFGHQNDDKPSTDFDENQHETEKAILEAEHRKPEKVVEPVTGEPDNKSPESSFSPSKVSPEPSTDVKPASDDLMQIKSQALKQLSPLVDHIDGTAEEKFRTLMMIIQSTDDQSLIPRAYKAAQAIEDEKAKAQALLDVVNEVNYFTSNQPED